MSLIQLKGEAAEKYRGYLQVIAKRPARNPARLSVRKLFSVHAAVTRGTNRVGVDLTLKFKPRARHLTTGAFSCPHGDCATIQSFRLSSCPSIS